MTSIQLRVSTLTRRINERIRVAPWQLFESTDRLWLILFDDLLLCPETGRQHRLDPGVSDLIDDGDFEALAEAARQLCMGDDRPVGLALPLSRFLYSHYSIQLGPEHLGDREMIHSTIELQKDLLLPAFDQAFALSAAVGRSEGVAFWLPETTLSRVESRFVAAGLELIAILPRPLAAVSGAGTDEGYVVSDSDSSSCTVIAMQDGVATQVLSASRQEFDIDDIKNAWSEQTAPLLDESTLRMATAEDWLALDGGDHIPVEYLFFTRAFQRSVVGKNRQRKFWAGGFVAAAALVVLSLPYVYQYVDMIRLRGERDTYKELAAVPAQYEKEILSMESEWGIVYEYPEVDVPAILVALNSVIKNSLTSFSLTDANVEIQGSVQDPEKLTKLLLEQPVFQSIEQSRSISESNTGSGDRFGLRLTLADHDYAGYSRKYDFK